MVDTLEIFRNSFVQAGSIIVQCDCGILHVADDASHMLEVDDKEWAENCERGDPDKVLHYSCTSIEWFWFGNKQVVIGCPCKEDEKIHNLLMGDQYQIISFFGKLLKAEKKEIEEKEKLMDGL